MTKKEQKQEEKRIRTELDSLLKKHLKDVFFCYHRKTKAVMVTYENFKPANQVKEEVEKITGEGWHICMKREYSDAWLKRTLLHFFKGNEVDVCYANNGKVIIESIRVYTYKFLENK